MTVRSRSGTASTAIPGWGLEMATAVSALDFSPTDLLAIGLMDGQVVIWNTRDNLESARFQAHSSPVKSLAFAPDGRTLATGGLVETGDGVRIWDTDALVNDTQRAAETRGIRSPARRPGRAADRAQAARPESAVVRHGGRVAVSARLSSPSRTRNSRSSRRRRWSRRPGRTSTPARKTSAASSNSTRRAASRPTSWTRPGSGRSSRSAIGTSPGRGSRRPRPASRKAQWDAVEAQARLELAKGGAGTLAAQEKLKDVSLKRAEAERDIAAAQVAAAEPELKASIAIGEIEKRPPRPGEEAARERCDLLPGTFRGHRAGLGRRA